MSRWWSIVGKCLPRKPGRVFRSMSVVLVLVVGIGIGLHFYFEYRARRVLDDALAETDLLDPGWRFEDMEASAAKLSPEKNGAIALLEVAKLLPKDFPSWEKVKFPGRTWETPEHVLKSRREQFDHKLMEMGQNQSLNDQQADAFEAKLTSQAKALEGALRLGEFSGGRLGLKRGKELDAANTHLPEIRKVGSLLSYQVIFQVHKREWSRAFAACEAMLHAGRCIGEEPDAAVQMVRAGFQGMAMGHLELMLGQGGPASHELIQFQKTLEREWQEELFIPSVRSNRALEYRLYEKVQSGEISREDFVQWGKFAKKFIPKEERTPDMELFKERWIPDRPNYVAAQASSLRRYNQLHEIAKKPIEEQLPLVQEWLKGPFQADELKLWLPEITYRACLRNKMKLKMGMAAIAAERFRQRHARWPANLAELVPQYLPEVPMDYYDGKPIRWLRLTDGIVLYSIGHHQTELADALQGKTMAEVEHNSIFSWEYLFQLWDPEKRRQAPQPVFPIEKLMDDPP